MEADRLSTKQINGLEQQITQLLKTMRTAKLSYRPIYAELQEFERELAEIRRQNFDNNTPEYKGF